MFESAESYAQFQQIFGLPILILIILLAVGVVYIVDFITKVFKK